MQSHHFQYFNITNQREKKKNKTLQFFVCGQTAVSVEVSQLLSAGCTDRWLVTVVTCSGNTKDCYQAERVCACVCLCVVCSVGFWCGGGLFMELCWARESSVQSQQRLGVLAFPLVFVFQRAGFHHRLGPECRKTHMLAMTAAEALTSLGSPCFFL